LTENQPVRRPAEQSTETKRGETPATVPSPQWRFWKKAWRRVLLAVLLLYWGALFASTHIPLPETDSQFNDKLAHLVAYGILAFLLAWLASHKLGSLPLAALVMSVVAVYGLLDELLQIPVSSRTADPWDWVADVAGAACGLVFFLACQFVTRQLFRKRDVAR
jgi:VanZ family protein